MVHAIKCELLLYFMLWFIVRGGRSIRFGQFLSLASRKALSFHPSSCYPIHHQGIHSSGGATQKSNRDEERVKIERTFVAIKPDAIQRNLVGEIIKRLENKGMRIVGMKLFKPPLSLVENHYIAHKGKPYFQDLIGFFSSAPIIAMVWEGNYAIELIRSVIGATHPENALPGTIRGDYCFQRGRTLIHSSDSVESAEREIRLWFTAKEIFID